MRKASREMDAAFACRLHSFFSYGETLAPVALFQNWCYKGLLLDVLIDQLMTSK